MCHFFKTDVVVNGITAVDFIFAVYFHLKIFYVEQFEINKTRTRKSNDPRNGWIQSDINCGTTLAKRVSQQNDAKKSNADWYIGMPSTYPPRKWRTLYRTINFLVFRIKSRKMSVIIPKWLYSDFIVVSSCFCYK